MTARWPAVVTSLLATAASAQPQALHSVEGRHSGYAFLSAQTQAQQDDDFANPGMAWVEQGQSLWRSRSARGQSCQDCHGDVGRAMRGVAARYPAFDPKLQAVVNLEQRINACRSGHQQESPWPYESMALLAMTTHVGLQSRGMPINVSIDGPAAVSFERGRAEYYQRRGQLDLSCAHCHEHRVGARLRGETISQGQINGHPVYRQVWETMGSTHRMFAWCNNAVRAQPYDYGAREYVDLELFVRWLGRGLAVETPAIRR
jgi:sulfur-oxidizing protein SoxA